MLSHMMMGNWASLRWVELAPSEQMFEVVHYKKGSSFLVFNKQLAPFGIPSFYWRWRCIVNDVNIIVNVLLGIRYFFTHRAFFPIILRVIQLVNMIVNALLGIRYFFHPWCPRPHSSESQIVSQYDCQRFIRYWVFFHPSCLRPHLSESHTVG